MKLSNRLKKGFTIVELVIVIAVIAILAAVLVPTFANLIDKANQSADTQLVRNLNTILIEEETTGAKPTSMGEVLAIEEENGYNVANLQAKAKDYQLVWNPVTNRFYKAKVDGTTPVYETYPDLGVPSQKPYEMWTISSAPDTTFSTYLYKATQTEFPNVTTGLDVGNESVTSIKYARSGEAHSVVIRTNGGTLTIDAPNDTIYHYNGIDKVVIETVAEHSYYEKGNVAVSMEVKDGHVVVESTGSVKELSVPETTEGNTVSIDVAAGAVVNTAVIDDASATVAVASGAQLGLIVGTTTNVSGEGATEAKENAVVKTYVYNAHEDATETTEAKLTLKEALEAESKSKYIVFAEDITVGTWSNTDSVGASITYDVTIDGAGHKFTVNPEKAIWVDASNVDVTIKNLKIVGGQTTARGIQVNPNIVGVKMLLDNIDISNISHYGINITNGAGVELTILNSKISAWGALNLWSANYTVRVDSCVLEGINDKGYDPTGWNGFATVVLEGDTTDKTEDHSSVVDVSITNSEIIAKSTTGNRQSAIGFNSKSTANRVVLKNTKITLDNSGNSYSYYEHGTGNELIIDGKVAEKSFVDLEKLSFNFDNVTFAEDGKSATGTVGITYDGRQYTMNLAEVTTYPWKNGTEYYFNIYLDKSLLWLYIDISPEYGDNNWCAFVSEYIK